MVFMFTFICLFVIVLLLMYVFDNKPVAKGIIWRKRMLISCVLALFFSSLISWAILK